MGQHNALDDDMPDYGETPEPEEGWPDIPPQRQAALANAAAGWVRRGYVVRYQDPLLMQLTQREPLNWRAIGWLALAVGSGIAAALLALAATRRRLWHVVTLVLRPDGRVIMHSQRAARPPSP